MPRDKISIIIPAYNEGDAIKGLVENLKARYPDFEIIVVNDGSTDDTGAKAHQAGAKVYTHPYNIGNGAAVKSGIRIATGDILVFMDGDGQHQPQDVARLLEYFPQYDMVVGARTSTYKSSWYRGLANRMYNRLASFVTQFKVEDLTSGFRAVKAHVIKRFVYLLPNTYSYPSTITICVLRSGRSIKYLPVDVRKREGGKSKISIMADGTKFFIIIAKICTLYAPMRVFLPVSMLIFLLGLAYYLYTFFMFHRLTNMVILLVIASFLTFMLGLISEQICQMRFENSENR